MSATATPPTTPPRRSGSLDCPICGFDAAVSKSSPGLIVARNLTSHYVRHRFCRNPECGATWKTVESLVIGSVQVPTRPVVAEERAE